MGALRRLRRQQHRRELAPVVQRTRELGPMSGALMDLMAHEVDIAEFDDAQLRLMLLLAQVAWNEASEPECADELRRKLVERFGAEGNELAEIFDQFIEIRRELFAHDPRIVLSTGIDYPNGKRRVLATSAMTMPRTATGRTA